MKKLILLLTILLLVLFVGCSKQQDENNGSLDTTDETSNENQDISDEIALDGTCTDGLQNQDETDVDCGGSCSKCKTGSDCKKNSDCLTNFCHEFVCTTPSCQDGLQNQDETDVDCGGVCGSCEKEESGASEKTQDENYKLTQEQENELQEKLTTGTKSAFLKNNYPPGLSPKESHVFAYGITNTFLKPGNKTFRFRIEFDKARDTSNSVIQAEEETLLEWFLQNEFPEPVLGKYNQIIFPVGVTVGEQISPNTKTKKGTYYFMLVTEYDEGRGFEKYTIDDFYIRVV